MNRKDVTPDSEKSHKGGFLGRFAIGIVGGVIGALLVVGIFYVAVGSDLTSNSNSTSGSSNTGTTKVSNVSVNVTSDVTKAVEKVQDAVVSVINLQKQSSNSGLGGLFEQKEDDSSGDLEAVSEGSGVIYKIDGDSAYVVTNNHVVDGQNGLEILLSDGTKVTGELVGTDSYTDLAVIKISSDHVKSVAEFGNSDSLKIGEPAIAIGSPLGSDYANSVTEGIISSVNRTITNTNESNQPVSINAIQTDAAINPGNSGGPLINIEGQVVGINSVKIVQSTSDVSVEGMGFAIPSNDVVSIINQLEANGKVVRPALGISMVDLSTVSQQQQEQILKVPTSVTAGVVIASVQAATPADQAGLEQYDVITKIDGEDVSDMTDLQSALYKKKVGDEMEITYYRGAKEMTTTVTLSIDQSALQGND